MADSPDTTNPTPPLSPDRLSALARRLREHAEHEPPLGQRGAMMSAADMIGGILKLQQADVKAVLNPVGTTRIVLDLPDAEAIALAQMVKRLGYDDAERLSSRYDGGEERYAMLAGIGKLQRALAEAGYSPR